MDRKEEESDNNPNKKVTKPPKESLPADDTGKMYMSHSTLQ